MIKNYGTHFVGIYDYNKSQAEAAHLIVNYTVAVKVPRHGFVNFQDPGIVWIAIFKNPFSFGKAWIKIVLLNIQKYFLYS